MYPYETAPAPPKKILVKLDRIYLDPGRRIFVVRDDLLPAGTKQRAILPLLADLKTRGIRHLTYASPFAGFAQVALAYGCRALGLSCALFCERDPKHPGMQPHTFTRLAESWGAEISLFETLEEAESSARAATQGSPSGTMKIPLGFQGPEFHRHLSAALAQALVEIKAALGVLPERTWLPVGSGTLTRAFREAAPTFVKLQCVDVHVLKPSDERIQSVKLLRNVAYHSAAESFAEEATVRPPLPSNIHYDAKLWSFLQHNAQDGDLWWNVAR